MLKKTFIKHIAYLLIGSSIFGLGYLFRHREIISESKDDITVIGPNSAIENSLSEMNIRDVVGVTDINQESNLQVYGQLFYNVTPEMNTEIHIRLKGLPQAVIGSQNNSQSIPTKLNILTARRSFDGLDFTYDEIGTVSLSFGEDEYLSGNFSTVLPAAKNLSNKQVSALDSVERIIFDSSEEEQKNIYVDENADLPAKVRSRPAPFFWIAL